MPPLFILTSWRRRGFDDAHPFPRDAGTLGLLLFLLALAVLFTASVVAYVVVRIQTPNWPPPGIPPLPRTLWLSTALILAGSATIHLALTAARRNRQRRAQLGLTLTTLLGFAFLITQTWNWFALAAREMTLTSNLYAWQFYVLTALHAAHLIGGLIPLAVVTARSYTGRYHALHHEPVKHCAIYWHFLDGVWIVLFTMLVIVG